MTVIIRKAEGKDKDAFVRLEREFCEYNHRLELSSHLERKPCSDVPDSFFSNAFDALLVKNIFFHITEINGEVIGCIEAEIVEPYEKELYGITKTGHINSVFVTSEHRGKGVGTALVNEAIKWIKSQGVELCTLGVVEGNSDAKASYEKLGFRPERTKMWKKI